MIDHSPEPWKVVVYSRNSGYIIDANGKIICVVSNKEAKRIIACVNACKDLPDIEIQAAIDQGGFIKILNSMASDIATLRKAKMTLEIGLNTYLTTHDEKPDVLNIIREENRQLAAEIEALRKQLHRL